MAASSVLGSYRGPRHASRRVRPESGLLGPAHLTDRAAALVRIGEHRKALGLLTAENIGGPEWVKYQTLLRQVVAELLDHDRRTPLRELAHRAGVRA
ncbi:hypothetical protein HLB23_40495 [Nocardia uniformis]|uniref:Uncharacterized protein n=1 Tax=Nocardia uniformis TaxID=53432 RepID=A0A849CGF6_9NOCA|nr:hypothetical protein [Nocardia uniformis]NNH76060.1 hypothetical protein [Nocardia uniformis]